MIVRSFLWALPLELLQIVTAVQPSAPSPISAPLRELPWAQLNFLHTTDTHGWHAGHLQEYYAPNINAIRSLTRCRPSYSADWGDYISFSHRLQEKADEDGIDLLLIDTGDRIEGNGLYDASHPKGLYDMEIFDQQKVDLICSGNHELYKRASIDFEYNTTVPNFGNSYIASNLDFRDLKTGEQKALAQRYKKFTTRNQGIRILALGFLFDFHNAARNIVVQKVEDTIKEKWFQDAIRDRGVDLFLVIGHVAIHSPEFDAIYKVIRGQQWDTPIQFFGGHTHIRDYAKYDKKAHALESGRYLETIGFMSIDGLNQGGKNSQGMLVSDLTAAISPALLRRTLAKSPTFARRYIDNNLFSYHHHTGLNSSTFPTELGLNVSSQIQSAREKLKLDHSYGCAPKTYWTNRAPFPSDFSIFTLLKDHVFPEMVSQDDRAETPRIVLTNTGAIRFDIFEGKFTTDSMYAVSPFTSGFRFIKNVPWGKAKLLLNILNQNVPQLWPGDWTIEMKAIAPVRATTLLAPSLEFHTETSGLQMAGYDGSQRPLTQAVHHADVPDLTPGYTTHDAAGSDGDDTLHSPIKFYQVPNCIQAEIAFPGADDERMGTRNSDPEAVDVVYNDFLEKYILLALQFLGTDYNEASTDEYMSGTGTSMTSLLGDWVKNNWKCPED